MKLRHIVTTFLILNGAIIFAQQDGEGEESDFYAGEVSKMIHMPSSPQAQAFTKYGDTQVNMYSGTPQISIPLHSIQGREMSLPLSLSYDASGIKVEQKASWVGLAWNLNVGGRISRIVNGLPDDYISSGNTADPYNTTDPYVTIFNDASVAQQAANYLENYADKANPQFPTVQAAKDYVQFMYEVANNYIDTERDYFSLNIMGLNETIVFENKNGIIVPRAMNNPRIKVKPTYATFSTISGLRYYILSWEIVSEDGTRYIFEEVESTKRTNQNDVNHSDLPGDLGTTTYISSWGISKIISKNQKDIFEFNYVNRGYEITPFFPSSASPLTTVIETQQLNWDYSLPSNYQPEYPNITSEVKEIFLSEIKHNGEKVVDVEFGNRDDVISTTTNSRLDAINFYNTVGSLPFKSISFQNNDYFNNDLVNPQYTDIRLKLNGLSIEDDQGTAVQNYYFEYDRPDDLPSRMSMSQDFLGFYNGASNAVLYQGLNISDINFPGANREPDCYYSKIGLLSQVTYPTGGRTTYKYESHDEYEISFQTSQNYKFVGTLNNNTTTKEDIFQDSDGNLCDESVFPVPKAKIYKFRINESEAGDYKFQFNKIVNSASIGIVLNTSVGRPRPYKSYCDFINPYDEHKLESNFIWSTSGMKTFTLEEGTYIVLLYTDTNSNEVYNEVSLTVSQQVQTATKVNRQVGGQRVASIIDYTTDNEISLHKKYSYREEGKSTGTINFQPILVRRPMKVENDELKPSLVRYANAIRSNEPYVVYTSVSEFKLDKDGRSLGSKKFDFYNGKKGATPSPEIPYTNTLYSGINVGTVKTTTAKRRDGKTVSTEDLNWFTTNYISNKIESLGVKANDTQAGKVVFIMVHNRNTSNEYFTIEYIWSFDCTSMPLTTSAGWSLCALPSYYTFDADNDLVDRMDEKFSPYVSFTTYAFGRYGGVNETNSSAYFYDEVGNEKIVTTVNKTEYDEEGDLYHLPKKQIVTDSKGDIYETEIKYAFEDSNTESLAQIENNNLVEVAETKTTIKNQNPENDKILSFRKNLYSIFPGQEGSIVLPTTIITQKGGDSETSNDNRIAFDYFSHGNLKSSQKTDGPKTLYIWGYDGRYPVAKIENATFSDVNELFDGGDLNLRTISDALPEELENTIRNGLSNAMVTTYTYEPYVGITSMTDPRGYTITYEYDEFNRLKAVRDAAGKLVTDYEYGYKQTASN